jgi:GMP synthase-like glutamine amidotransferase
MGGHRYVGTVRAVLIGNAGDLDAGFVGGHLRRCGYQFSEGQREHPVDWPALDDVDLVLTLGSEWNVYRPETAPCVEAEAALVRHVTDRGIPLLAICFGAQVLSHALGGAVTRAPTPEIGWFTVAVDGPPIAEGPWMEWHDDVFTAPPGFDVLARTDAGPQLIRGRRALGTQFHPEATETMVRDWIEHGGAEAYRRHGGDPDVLLAETRVNVALSRPAAEALGDWFLEHVAGA